MGFTRYWMRPRELERGEFFCFAKDCSKACNDLKIPLRNFVFSSEMVSFEGEPACEPFIIERVSSGRERDGKVFEYCKTEKLPYDAAVEQCLKLLKERFQNLVELPEAQ